MLTILGFMLIILGAQYFYSSWKFRFEGIKTEAAVIENIRMQSAGSKTSSVMYTPVLAYYVDGEKKTYSPNSSANPPTYAIGEKVLLVYSSKNTQHVRIVSYWGIYLGSNILFVFGIPMFLVGLGYFLFKWDVI